MCVCVCVCVCVCTDAICSLHIKCISSLQIDGFVDKICLLVYLRDESDQTISHVAILSQELQTQTFHLTLSQYTDTRPASLRTNSITSGRVATGGPI